MNEKNETIELRGSSLTRNKKENAKIEPNGNSISRRSFINKGLAAGAGAAAMGLMVNNANADKGSDMGPEKGKLTPGDADILRFLAAAEILETDAWQQYNELGGIQDSEVPGGSGSPAYAAALAVLDSDMSQYIHDNTEDEFTHFTFLNAYLVSKGAKPVNLDQFRTLPGSTATGSSGKPRLTNLMQLTLDTSWWTRYRSRANNPDLDPNFTFPQAVPTLFTGEHTAIPRTDNDLNDPNFLQAIIKCQRLAVRPSGHVAIPQCIPHRRTLVAKFAHLALQTALSSFMNGTGMVGHQSA